MGTILDTARLKQLIEEKFETQAAFAEACDVSRQYIFQVVKGERTPSLKRMAQFAALLGVPVDSLMVKEPAR